MTPNHSAIQAERQALGGKIPLVVCRAIIALAAPAVRARAKSMSSDRPANSNKPLLTMHDWEAKHYVLAAVIILVVMGLFAYSWS